MLRVVKSCVIHLKACACIFLHDYWSRCEASHATQTMAVSLLLYETMAGSSRARAEKYADYNSTLDVKILSFFMCWRA